MKSISGTIANMLWTQGVIQKDDIDTCRYGLDVFISSAIEIVSIFIIAVFMGNFFETVLLFTTFIPLRIYVGGYHADTKLKCYLISLGFYGFFTVVMNTLSQKLYLTTNLIISVFSLLVVMAAAPVIHKNKTVNEVERKHYRKFGIWICSAEMFVILLLTVIFPQSPYIISLAIGQAGVTISMIVAIIKGKMAENKKL